MAKYKVGDKVRVRKDLTEHHGHPGYYPNDQMLEKAGQIVTIKEVREFSTRGIEYHIEEDEWFWTDEMFDGIAIDWHIDNNGTCSLTINPDALDSTTYITSDKLADLSKEKEIKKMDCKKILDIYFSRMEKRILEEKKNKDKEIKENDKIQRLLEDTENEINVMLDRDEEHRYKLPTVYTYTDETDMALIENEKETDKQIEKLYQLKEEVEAQLSIILEDNYETAIEVLKNYEILDKKGKINA